MNRQHRFPRRCAAPFLLAAALGFLAASAAATPVTPTLQHRIDVLLKRRLSPEPLPSDLPNPFQVVKGSIRENLSDDIVSRQPALDGVMEVTRASETSQPRAAVVTSNTEVLAGAAAKLKVGGIIILKDQIQVVINGMPRKEGDLVAADWNNNLVYLRVLRLFTGEMVLSYADAEITLKL
jgi:hypothetical protein